DDARAAVLSEELIELVNLRVSQLNGCAFCLDLHTRYAVKAGVSDQRRVTLSAWCSSAQLYTAQERATLSLAVKVSSIEDIEPVQAVQFISSCDLTQEQYAAVQWLAMPMNLTNRISILSHHPVRPSAETRLG